MKKLSTLFAAVVFAVSLNAQTVFYTENMGTPTGTTSIVANVFQNFAPITYTGTADVRTTSPSDYTGASAGGNILFNAINENFIVSGIDSRNFADITMSFGQIKTTNASSNELTVEVSADGTVWTPLTYTRPTGSGTIGWLLISPAGAIPSTQNLRIRFVLPTVAGGIQFRIDDLKLTGTDTTLGVNNTSLNNVVLVKNTSVKNAITFATKSDIKIISANGQVVKTASVDANTTLEVSTLPKGMYLVTGIVNGTAVSQKIIKN